MADTILIRGVPVKFRDGFYLEFSRPIDPKASLELVEKEGLLWFSRLNEDWDEGVLADFALLIIYEDRRADKATVQAYSDMWRVAYEGEYPGEWIERAKALISKEFDVEVTVITEDQHQEESWKKKKI